MEKCLIHQCSFPGHCGLWDLRTRVFFFNFLIIRKNILFSQFLFRASSSRYCCEYSCNWESVLSAPVERAHLSEAGDELTEQEKKGLLWKCVSRFPNGVLMASRAEALSVSPLSHSRWTWWLFWFSSARRKYSNSGCVCFLEFLLFLGQRQVVGTSLWLRLQLAYPGQCFLPDPACVYLKFILLRKMAKMVTIAVKLWVQQDGHPAWLP